MNQGLRLLEAAGSHTVVVKKERDEAKEDAEEQEELAGQLVQSENAKMTQIDELKAAVSTKDTRIGELEASLRAKDAMIAELRGRVAELEKSGTKTAAKTKKPAAPPKPATEKRKAAPPAKKPAKKTKTKKTDATCPLSSMSWYVWMIDAEYEEHVDAGYVSMSTCYESQHEIVRAGVSNQTLKMEAYRRDWNTLREDHESVEFYPYFELKNGQEYDYEFAKIGRFDYADAMKVIRDHKAGGKRGRPTIHFSLNDRDDINGGVNFEFKRDKKTDELQFRFVDAEVEILSLDSAQRFDDEEWAQRRRDEARAARRRRQRAEVAELRNRALPANVEVDELASSLESRGGATVPMAIM